MRAADITNTIDTPESLDASVLVTEAVEVAIYEKGETVAKMMVKVKGRLGSDRRWSHCTVRHLASGSAVPMIPMLTGTTQDVSAEYCI